MRDTTDMREVKFVEATRIFDLSTDEVYLLRFFLELEKESLGSDEDYRVGVWRSLLGKIGGKEGFVEISKVVSGVN